MKISTSVLRLRDLKGADMSFFCFSLALMVSGLGHRSRLLQQHLLQSSALQELGGCCQVVPLLFPIGVVSYRPLRDSQHFIFYA